MIAFPSGWVGATVGEILEFKYGRGLPEKLRKPGSYRVFGSNGVVGCHDKALTAPPSIIVGRKGSIGEVHYSEEPCYPIDTTYYVDHFECGEPRFILHLLKNLQLQNLNRATAVPGLNRDDAYALEIGLPPRVEQRRIAAKIDSLSAKSKRARNHLDHIPRLVEKYKQAILAAAFRGNLTREWRVNHFERVPVKPRGQQIKNGRVAPDDDFVAPYDIPDGWTWLLLPQIGEIDRGRSRHRPRNDPRLFGGRYPFIQTGEVRAANRFLASFTETYSDFGLSQSRLWPKGTVCITIAANIAETAILAIDACFPDSIVGFTADNERTMPSYVEFFLRTARDELTAFAPATAQKNINLGRLKLGKILNRQEPGLAERRHIGPHVIYPNGFSIRSIALATLKEGSGG
jgi:restriction endonuclease S subunit